MKKLLITCVTTLAFMGLFAGNAFAELKVGIVDFMQAIEQTEKDGALKKLKADFDKRQKQLKDGEQKIMKLQKDIEENQALLSEDALRTKVVQYQTLVSELQKDAMKYEQELAEKRNKILGGIQDKMTKIATDIAKEKSLDIIIERNDGAIIYFKSTFDYTDELIKRYKAGK